MHAPIELLDCFILAVAMFYLNGVGVFVDRFTVITGGQVTKNHRFPKFVWHRTTSIVNFCMFQVAAVPVQCLWRITFLIFNV